MATQNEANDGGDRDASRDDAIDADRDAADAGDANAMARVAGRYYTGTGVARDCAESLRWYRKAANLGNARSMAKVGYLYHGWGVDRDYAMAMTWFRKAAEAGDGFGMRYVAYFQGWGVPKTAPRPTAGIAGNDDLQVYKIRGTEGDPDFYVFRVNDRLRMPFTVDTDRETVVVHDIVSREFARRYA